MKGAFQFAKRSSIFVSIPLQSLKLREEYNLKKTQEKALRRCERSWEDYSEQSDKNYLLSITLRNLKSFNIKIQPVTIKSGEQNCYN